MKLKYILLAQIILVSSLKAQSMCYIWKHDYGSAQDARINTLKAEVSYHQNEYNNLKKIKRYNDDVLVARSQARAVTLAKQTEYQRLANQVFNDRMTPNFEIRRSADSEAFNGVQGYSASRTRSTLCSSGNCK
jgi:hypothetical protein